MLEEWGCRWEELLRILRALSDRALDLPNSTDCSERKALEVDLATRTRIASDRITAALDELVLARVATYDPREREHKPWGVNRSRSYVRRPLVLLPDGRIAWSADLFCGPRAISRLCAPRIGWMLPARCGTPSGRLLRASTMRSRARWREFQGRGLARSRGSRQARWRAPGARAGAAHREPRRRRLRPATGCVWLLEAKRLFPSLVPFTLDTSMSTSPSTSLSMSSDWRGSTTIATGSTASWAG